MIKFTKEEKIILLFLLAAFFIGMAVFYYKKLNPAAFQVIELDEKKVNINTASREELIKIKNVGPVLAGRIISYREKFGPFRKKEDIKNIKGIGDKTYEKIKEEIVLE